jgi:SAM-dependent methyltransferase
LAVSPYFIHLLAWKGRRLVDKGRIKQTLRQAYDRHAGERDRQRKEEWRFRLRQRFADRLLSEGKRMLLEIGAGPGHDSLYFKECGLKPVAVDLSPEMVHLCREKGIEAHCMDAYELDFLDERFDAVWSVNCLVHVPKRDLDRVLTEISRVLKPDGLFYLGMWGGIDVEGVWEEDLYEPKRFFSFFPDEAIKERVSRHFDPVSFEKVETGNGKLHFQSMVLRKGKHNRSP